MTESDSPAKDAVVIVVAYNEAKGIVDCLSALLHQDTRQSYEVVVVDDGSTDNTTAIVEDLQEHDSRLRLIKHDTNRGRGAARRTGQDAAQALYTAFVDADIVVPSDWLERCSNALEEFSAVSAVPLPDGDSAVVWRIFRSPARYRVGFSGITGNNVIFKTDVLRLVPFDSRHTLGEDFRVSHRLLQRGYRLSVLADLTVEHREEKSYRRTLKYMWETGVDAASHPFEFRIIRVPDVAWLIWFVWSTGSLLASALGAWSWFAGIASAAAILIAVTVAFTWSRFHIRPNPFRWIASASACLPLLLSYLLGRTWGLLRLVAPRYRPAR